METEYRYTTAGESDLDTLLSGKEFLGGIRFGGFKDVTIPKLGSTGVIWKMGTQDDASRPLVLISNEEDVRRLCGRYAQLHSDLSPLTAWCHLMSPQFLEPMVELVRRPHLEGFEAAWVGLIVAEAMLLSERALHSVRMSSCLATPGFAIARTCSLWRDIPIEAILQRFEAANRLCRNESAAHRSEGRAARLRASMQPLWSVLVGCVFPEVAARDEFEPLVTALKMLRRARLKADAQEALQLMKPLLPFCPEAELLGQLPELPPESRLRLFDKLVEGLEHAYGEKTPLRRSILAALAGYLATVAAGGAPSLTLAENHAARFPEITAWAYVIGGIGESVVWTSSFDGLGRLVSRELLRPARFDEPPVCDFSFDEALVLADPGVSDPLVHLRVKQARAVTVALFPGVNITIPMTESAPAAAGKAEPQRSARNSVDTATRDTMMVFAEAVWPYIEKRLDEYFRSHERGSSRDPYGDRQRRTKGRSGQYSEQLPLPGNPKK